MPAKEGPYHIRGETEMHDIPSHEKVDGSWAQPVLPVGLVREFQVLRRMPMNMHTLIKWAPQAFSNSGRSSTVAFLQSADA